MVRFEVHSCKVLFDQPCAHLCRYLGNVRVGRGGVQRDVYLLPMLYIAGTFGLCALVCFRGDVAMLTRCCVNARSCGAAVQICPRRDACWASRNVRIV